jgi:long-chain acyl-CoA synthetase
MKGYYKNEEATAESIRDGWLFTGDMGYFDEDGFLMVTGREKALLISEDGEKYSPEEIEEAIANSSEMINQVMLYNDHKKYTTALVTLEESKVKEVIEAGKAGNVDELLGIVRNEFYAFESTKEYQGAFQKKWIPSVFYIVGKTFNEEDGMINSTLKMVRFKITEVYGDLIEQMYISGSNSIKSEHNLDVLKQYFGK